MVFVTARHMVGGTYHEHIASVRWQDPGTAQTGETQRADMVTWIRGGGQAFVQSGSLTVAVGVVDANPPYIRTFADGVWTDNLLALPTY
ncbi:MAG: DUF3892 domain-containing protein [Chloroflexota bacterium]